VCLFKIFYGLGAVVPFKKQGVGLGIVVHTCSSSTWKAEAGG
jgi:hypothetical protein